MTPPGIGARVIFAAVMPMLVLAAILTTIYTHAQLDDIEQTHVGRATALARQLAAASEYAVFSGNTDALQRLVLATLEEEAVASIRVVDAAGLELAGSHLPEHALPPLEVLPGQRNFQRVDHELIRIVEPIRPASVVLDEHPAELAIEPAPQTHDAPFLGNVVVDISRAPIRQKHAALIQQGLLVVALVFIGALALAVALSQGVSRPIRQVARTVARIGQGNFDERVPLIGGGSLGELANGVNQMATKLAATHADLNQQIEQATAELRARKDEAEQASIAKTRFLAAASHDLRQPMHALGLFITELSQHRLAPASRHLVTQISASSSAMADLLDSLLDLSRLEAGMVQPRIRPFPLQSVFERIESAFRPEAITRGIRFRIHPSHLWTRSDPVLLERILGNLVSNALRYTPSGSVLLGCRRHQGQIVLQVRDNGIGIPRASQSIIFREFVQLNNPERAKDKGLGLGLAIVARLAELLTHPVSLSSSPERGSIFSCTLPLHASELQESDDTSQRAPGDIAGLRVWLFDGDTLALRSMEGLLTSWGCRVRTAASLDQLAASCGGIGSLPAPDAVICDLRLPGALDGVRTISRVRAQFRPPPAAALVTGDTSPDITRLAQDAALPLMIKPLRPARLRAFLNRVGASHE